MLFRSTGRRAGTGQEPGRSRAATARPHHSDTEPENARICRHFNIFARFLCSAEKRLTTRTRLRAAAGRQKRRQTTAPDKSHHLCAGASYFISHTMCSF